MLLNLPDLWKATNKNWWSHRGSSLLRRVNRCPLWHHRSKWWARPISGQLGDSARLGFSKMCFYVQKPHGVADQISQNLNFGFAASSLIVAQNPPGFILMLSVIIRSKRWAKEMSLDTQVSVSQGDGDHVTLDSTSVNALLFPLVLAAFLQEALTPHRVRYIAPPSVTEGKWIP